MGEMSREEVLETLRLWMLQTRQNAYLAEMAEVENTAKGLRERERALQTAITLLSQQEEKDEGLAQKAQAYMETQPLNLLVDVLNFGANHCFTADLMKRKPDEAKVLSIVAAAVLLAKHYGYSMHHVARLWQNEA